MNVEWRKRPPTQDQARRLRLWVRLYRLPETTTIAIYCIAIHRIVLLWYSVFSVLCDFIHQRVVQLIEEITQRYIEQKQIHHAKRKITFNIFRSTFTDLVSRSRAITKHTTQEALTSSSLWRLQQPVTSKSCREVADMTSSRCGRSTRASVAEDNERWDRQLVRVLRLRSGGWKWCRQRHTGRRRRAYSARRRFAPSHRSTRLGLPPPPSTSSSPPPPTNRRSKSSSVHNRTNRVGRWHGSRSLRLRGAQLLTGSATRLPCVLMRSCISIITVRSRSTGRWHLRNVMHR